jgi:hypothetical protein
MDKEKATEAEIFQAVNGMQKNGKGNVYITCEIVRRFGIPFNEAFRLRDEAIKAARIAQ